jgi:hypothetical protein
VFSTPCREQEVEEDTARSRRFWQQVYRYRSGLGWAVWGNGTALMLVVSSWNCIHRLKFAGFGFRISV